MAKKWAVVQDLSPFGIRIVSRHWFRFTAASSVALSRYLTVMRLEEAKRENARIQGRNIREDVERHLARRDNR